MKKFIALLLVVALTATISVSATMAYLQDEDSDVNVMTMGNVSIEQLEYERVVENGAWVSTGETDKYGYTPDKVQEFQQKKPLYPAVFTDGTIKWDDRNGSQAESGEGSHQQSWGQVGASGSNQLFDDSVKNVQDKFVFVKNTGKSDAYVRTLIALEQGSIAADNFNNVIMTNSNLIHWSWETVATDVEIDGSKYYVICATYLGPTSNPSGILAPDAVSYPSLLQVYMRPEATNEDVENIDGNKNGTYDILVLSQAVQVEGFSGAATALNTAFGELNAANAAAWFQNVKANPFAVVTTLSKNTVLTNADGDVDVVKENLTIDTTGSSMGLNVGSISMDVLYQFEPLMSLEEGAESEYADWHADFVVSVDKDIPAYGIGLAGYYDAWCSLNNDKWVMLASPDPITAGTEIRLVDAMGSGSITVSYEDLCQYGNDGIGFLCGAVDMSGKTINGTTVEQIPAGTTLTVELRLYEATGGSRDTETGEYITTGTYTYTFN